MEEKLDAKQSKRIVDIPSGKHAEESSGKENDSAYMRRKHRAAKHERQQFLDLRERAFDHVVGSSKTVLTVALLIILLQGFGLGGFNLPKEILYALLVATIGKTAESLIIVMRFLFRG